MGYNKKAVSHCITPELENNLLFPREKYILKLVSALNTYNTGHHSKLAANPQLSERKKEREREGAAWIGRARVEWQEGVALARTKWIREIKINSFLCGLLQTNPCEPDHTSRAAASAPEPASPYKPRGGGGDVTWLQNIHRVQTSHHWDVPLTAPYRQRPGPEQQQTLPDASLLYETALSSRKICIALFMRAVGQSLFCPTGVKCGHAPWFPLVTSFSCDFMFLQWRNSS